MARLSSLDQRNFTTFKSEAGKKQGSISFRNIAEETVKSGEQHVQVKQDRNTVG